MLEHDCAADRNTGLVRKEVLEGLLVIITPVAEERADVEEAI